jgi:hypothetical protein
MRLFAPYLALTSVHRYGNIRSVDRDGDFSRDYPAVSGQYRDRIVLWNCGKLPHT